MKNLNKNHNPVPRLKANLTNGVTMSDLSSDDNYFFVKIDELNGSAGTLRVITAQGDTLTWPFGLGWNPERIREIVADHEDNTATEVYIATSN